MQINDIKSAPPLLLHFKIQEQKVIKTIQKNMRRLIEAEKKGLYRNNLKNRNFGKEAPQNFDSERAIIAERQGASENQNCEVKPTQPKTDSSGYFGIEEEKRTFNKWTVCILYTR